LAAQADSFVVVIDSDRQGALGVLLAHDVAIELFDDRPWRRVLGALRRLLFGEDVVAQSHALVTDEDARTGNQLSDFSPLLSAEGAVELFHPEPILTCLEARAIAPITDQMSVG